MTFFNTGYNIEVDEVLMKVSPIRPHDTVLISHITMWCYYKEIWGLSIDGEQY